MDDINKDAFTYYSHLKRVKEYVDEHFSEEIRLGQIAQIAYMEATYFSAYFHEKVGISFSQWLRQLRIEKAIEIMETEDRRITEIALDVGFGDLRTFERAFKRYTGSTPRDFKKSVIARHISNGNGCS